MAEVVLTSVVSVGVTMLTLSVCRVVVAVVCPVETFFIVVVCCVELNTVEASLVSNGVVCGAVIVGIIVVAVFGFVLSVVVGNVAVVVLRTVVDLGVCCGVVVYC